jgi:NADH-quinone oxidoreductase subunit J
MSNEAIVFWAAGIFTVVGAFMTITRRNPVSSVMWLVLTFLGFAAIFVGMGAYFVAAIQVLVYAGAIMVLFLFVIMLLDLKDEKALRIGGPALRVSAIAAGIALFVGLGLVVRASVQYGAPAEDLGLVLQPDQSQVQLIASLLFTKYLLPFEVTSALLLAAIVGAVVISRRGRAES